MPDAIQEFSWILHITGLVVLLWMVNKLLGIRPAEIFRTLIREIKLLTGRNFEVGVVNIVGVITMLVFGMFLIITDGQGAVARFVMKIAGEQQAEAIQGQVDPMALGYCLVFIVVVSVYVVAKHK